MFDEETQKKYLFLGYLLGLLLANPIDLGSKLLREYYKLQKTFKGAIQLQRLDGQYIPAKEHGGTAQSLRSTLDGILEKINEKYKGNFTDADRVVIQTLHDKLITDQKPKDSARTNDSRIFTESIFPKTFGNVAMESYMESQESYSSLFEDLAKYSAVMSALGGMVYSEMRSGNVK